MKKNTIVLISIIIIYILICTSCTATENVLDDTKNIADKFIDISKNSLAKAKEKITGDNTTDQVIDKYTDKNKVSDYNLETFKIDMESKGYNVQLVAKDKDFFDAPKFEINIDNDTILGYDYEEMITLDKDMSDISEKGLYIGGSKIEWKDTPHYFKKGELLIIYDGENTGIIDTLNDIFQNQLFY